MPAKKKAKQRQVLLPERFTIIESPETRTLLIGLHANGEDDQRYVTLREPNLVQLGELQTEGNRIDAELPRPTPAEDPQNPTGDELMRQIQETRAQHEYIFGAEHGQPYGQFFLKIANMLSGEEVKAEDLPAWTAAPESTRRVLDFFKSPLSGVADAEALAAILQRGNS